jgi:hypothetical protein
MRQIKILLDFFKQASEDNLGIKNLYGKVDYYNEHKQILQEKERPDIDINDYLTSGHELKAAQKAELSTCYLFVREPPEPKTVIDAQSLQLKQLSENEARVRLNFKALLKEAGSLDSYLPLIRDEN